MLEEVLVAKTNVLWRQRIADIFSDTIRKAKEHTEKYPHYPEDQIVEMFRTYVLKRTKAVSKQAAKILAESAAEDLGIDGDLAGSEAGAKYTAACHEASERAVSTWWRGYFSSHPDASPAFHIDSNPEVWSDAAFHVIMFVCAAAYQFASKLTKENQK